MNAAGVEHGNLPTPSASPDPDDVTKTVPVTEDTAMVNIRKPGEPFDLYRMFITLPDQHRRYVLNRGLTAQPDAETSADDIRGFAIFRQRRLALSEVSTWRKRLRESYRIGVLATFTIFRSTNDGRL